MSNRDLLKNFQERFQSQLVLGCVLLLSLAPAQSFSAPLSNYDPGAQLNRTHEFLERERAKQAIKEGQKAREAQKESRKEGQKERAVPEVSFPLKRFDVSHSDVLSEEEIRAVASRYEGRTVRLAELYEFLDAINALYTDRGFVTCRAFLPAQKIVDGVVRVRLVEGKTGKVIISGNAHTNETYVRDRVSLTEGAIVSIQKLNDELLRFNATNDARLRISMRAGEAPGTTDYEITVAEPERNHVIRGYADTNGYESNSRYRAGVTYTNRSLTGRRDTLSATLLKSRGSGNVTAIYSVPVHPSGLRLETTVGYNRNEIVNGWMEPLGVKGKGFDVGVALRYPYLVTETDRVDIAAELQHQESETDLFVKTSNRQKWVDDKTDKMRFSVAATHYADWGIFYHRHSLVTGRHTNIDDKKTNFYYYGLDSLALVPFENGFLVETRLTAQVSAKSLMPSAQRFYLGGVQSVRGYEEGLINGEHGINLSVEASRKTSVKGLDVYGFLDAGFIWGDSAFGDKKLAGIGMGVKYVRDDWLSLDFAVGVPIKRNINEERQDAVRVHATLTATY